MKKLLEWLVSNSDKVPQMDGGVSSAAAYNPLSELMRAMILRTVEDYKSGSGENYDEAVEYMMSEEDEYIFSFRAICRTLGFDPEKTRHAIMHATHRISTRRRAA